VAFELWRAERNGTLTCQEHGLRLVVSGGGDDHGTTFTVTRISDGYPLASGLSGSLREAMEAAQRMARRFVSLQGRAPRL